MERNAVTAMAVGAHPDDVEFMMAGTLLMLGQAGAALHAWNLANGCYGTTNADREEIVRVRAEEAAQSAALAGAVLHPPLVDDLGIVHEPGLVARVASIIRAVQPDILLVPAPDDYMEDHVNTARLVVTAAFARASATYVSDPPAPPWEGSLAIYHALPYGLRDQLGNAVPAGMFVDITTVMERKGQMLSSHRSQEKWLDASQGIGSYVRMMEEMAEKVGAMSGRFGLAEGWRRHLPLGFAAADFDPLAELLGDSCHRESHPGNG